MLQVPSPSGKPLPITELMAALQASFEGHQAEILQRAEKAEAEAARLRKERDDMKRSRDDLKRKLSGKAQLEFASEVSTKILGSAAFYDALLNIIKASNEAQTHEVYKSLRGWIPGPKRTQAQELFYHPGAEARASQLLYELTHAKLQDVAPASWKALSSFKALSASDLRKVEEPQSNVVPPSEPAGPDMRNKHNLVPESPDYREYCMEPDLFGYDVIPSEEGPQVGIPDPCTVRQVPAATLPAGEEDEEDEQPEGGQAEEEPPRAEQQEAPEGNPEGGAAEAAGNV